jgi:hypothetical protein
MTGSARLMNWGMKAQKKAIDLGLVAVTAKARNTLPRARQAQCAASPAGSGWSASLYAQVDE